MTSVDSYFKFSVWQSTWDLTPSPPSTCVHLSLTPSPLRVDVINGRPHTVPLFHAEAPHATASEGLTQGPYLAARAGFKSTTLRAKGVESTNAPPHPMILCVYVCICVYVYHSGRLRINATSVLVAR